MVRRTDWSSSKLILATRETASFTAPFVATTATSSAAAAHCSLRSAATAPPIRRTFSRVSSPPPDLRCACTTTSRAPHSGPGLGWLGSALQLGPGSELGLGGRTIRVRARPNLVGARGRLRGSARGGRPRRAPRRPRKPVAQWAARAGRARLCPSRRRGPRRHRAPRPSTGW